MPESRKTSFLLSPEAQRAYELAKLQQSELTLADFLNRAAVFYVKYESEAGFDPLLTTLKRLEKSLQEIVLRESPTPATIDAAFLAQEVAVKLRPMLAQISAQKSVQHVPKWRLWLKGEPRATTDKHW